MPPHPNFLRLLNLWLEFNSQLEIEFWEYGCTEREPEERNEVEVEWEHKVSEVARQIIKVEKHSSKAQC